jgi:DNA-binding HxlR family transcriptional regulator
MRTYRQYCGLAKALDIVGDRWTLLIVRELLILGPSRYTDLRNGLPGIATNLLVDRLRELEEAGVVERTEAPPPVATTLFRLTPHGEALRPVIKALGAWAGPTLESWNEADEFRSHWLALPLDLHLVDRAPSRPPVTIEVRTGDQPIIVDVGGGDVRVRRGSADEHADLVVSGPPDAVLATLLGRVQPTAARRRGVRLEGDERVLQRVQPQR